MILLLCTSGVSGITDVSHCTRCSFSYLETEWRERELGFPSLNQRSKDVRDFSSLSGFSVEIKITSKSPIIRP
jgi:hypothetical protein